MLNMIVYTFLVTRHTVEMKIVKNSIKLTVTEIKGVVGYFFEEFYDFGPRTSFVHQSKSNVFLGV